jgi:hypothetical protein
VRQICCAGASYSRASIEPRIGIPQLAGMIDKAAAGAGQDADLFPAGRAKLRFCGRSRLVRPCRRRGLLDVPGNQEGATQAEGEKRERGDKPPDGAAGKSKHGFCQPGYGTLDPRGRQSRGISGDQFLWMRNR